MNELMALLPNLAGAYANKTGNHISTLDLLKRMGEVCLNCDRLGTEAFVWEEVEDDDL